MYEHTTVESANKTNNKYLMNIYTYITTLIN